MTIFKTLLLAILFEQLINKEFQKQRKKDDIERSKEKCS